MVVMTVTPVTSHGFELDQVITRVALRRNKWFAHLDVRTVSGPQELNKMAELSIPDLDVVFRETEKLLANLEYIRRHRRGDSLLGWRRL